MNPNDDALPPKPIKTVRERWDDIVRGTLGQIAEADQLEARLQACRTRDDVTLCQLEIAAIRTTVERLIFEKRRLYE